MFSVVTPSVSVEESSFSICVALSVELVAFPAPRRRALVNVAIARLCTSEAKVVFIQ